MIYRKGGNAHPYLWWTYPRFLADLTFAQRALCAAAILLRPAAEIVRFLRVETDFDLLPRM
jgi:hypothetical protein